ncbi:MAG TPA: peptide chain release factor N(5)-glutamine methyltransferase [Xanthobacteraceae bacterium]|jgi:release factor glutamine methyltransferase|nr:peptide chain release factor N(5)-glutamine methyltransferase [Xanthobacteraceae bacterium]
MILLEPTSSIAIARRKLSNAFRLQGFETPDLDARVLIGHALALDHSALISFAERQLTPAECERIAEFAKRRLAREPVARIIGSREFWGLPFTVTSAVLVPRPETETIVETALALIDAKGGRARPMRVLDVGTGSGAILLALLSELPGAFGIGTDTSIGALTTARENARHLGMAERAHFIACDFGSALAGGFELVVSNPPYIATGEIQLLEPEVRDHDPIGALDGGHDGLACYRAIAADAARLLGQDGHIVLELGIGQADPVSAIFHRAGLAVPAPARPDLTGIPRAFTAAKPPEGNREGPQKVLGLSPKTQ